MDSYSISLARPILGDLVRRAVVGRERITISDHRRPVAVVIGLHDLRELERRAALGDRYAAAAAAGEVPALDAEDARTVPEAA